ncbi:MAG TPA: AraC family transcriptional regulator [Actinoplanes sp.]|jgi:AraC-like DNA-binding protein
MDSVEKAVERAIATIRTSFADDVTIDDLARAAMFSKFHFTRVFRRTTGVSPGRFLSAVRLQEAKHLLLETSLSIADISRLVGYHSVGTFSTRFTRSVGVPPTVFRQYRGITRIPPEAPCLAKSLVSCGSAKTEVGSVAGMVWPPAGRSGPVYVGLFPGRIPEGPPVGCTVVHDPAPVVLDNIPVGRYYMLCQTAAPAGAPEPGGERAVAAAVAASEEITVVAGETASFGELRLRPARPADPPVLVALSAL